jgi:tetrahydromethanopterin S-methyltransferase subunit G
MQALSDEQHIERLEVRMDRFETKIESVRSEARTDFRLLLGVQLTTLVGMILGFAGILLQHLS